jgi:hypothetical protein
MPGKHACMCKPWAEPLRQAGSFRTVLGPTCTDAIVCISRSDVSVCAETIVFER